VICGPFYFIGKYDYFNEMGLFKCLELKAFIVNVNDFPCNKNFDLIARANKSGGAIFVL
jgi:hypothetical protein